MFSAVRRLKMGEDKKSVKVKDFKGRNILSENTKVSKIREWFQEKFYDTEALDSLEPKKLNNPITEKEIRQNRKRLKNNRSSGPDDISNEIIKYAGVGFDNAYAKAINKCFELGQTIDIIGKGT